MDMHFGKLSGASVDREMRKALVEERFAHRLVTKTQRSRRAGPLRALIAVALLLTTAAALWALSPWLLAGIAGASLLLLALLVATCIYTQNHTA